MPLVSLFKVIDVPIYVSLKCIFCQFIGPLKFVFTKEPIFEQKHTGTNVLENNELIKTVFAYFPYFWRKNLPNFKFNCFVLRTCPSNLLNFLWLSSRKFPFSVVLAQVWISCPRAENLGSFILQSFNFTNFSTKNPIS